MKIGIFLIVNPCITETFIFNEFDILKKDGISFQVLQTYENTRVNQPDIYKYKKYFLYIPRYNKNSFVMNFFRILYYHIKILLLYPFRYIGILVWILTHYDRNFLRCFLRIAKVIHDIGRFNPDMFYCRYADDALIFTFLVAKFFNKIFGMIYYSVYPNFSYIKYINSSLSFIIVKADYIKMLYLKIHPDLDKDKIKVLPWGIDMNYFQPPRNKCKFNKIFTILAISQMIEKKGLIYLVKACHLLLRQNISFRCILVGDGPEKDNLKKYIKQYKIDDSIELRKAIPHSLEFKKLMLAADVFVLPSTVDSKGDVDVIPNVLLEAMAMELPVITTKVNGMFEVIEDGKNGFFTEDKNENDLAIIIKKVMNMSIEERQKIGKKARKRVLNRYDKEKQGNKFINFLKSKVNKNAY